MEGLQAVAGHAGEQVVLEVVVEVEGGEEELLPAPNVGGAGVLAGVQVEEVGDGSVLGDLAQARWHRYEPLARDNTLAGAQLAFGRPLNAVHRFDRADVVLSLDADFLAEGPAHLRYTRDFTERRRLDGTMSRLYVVEGSSSITGAKADHRLLLRPGDVERVAHAVGARWKGIARPREDSGIERPTQEGGRRS